MKQLRLKKNGKAPLVAGAFDGESEDDPDDFIMDGLPKFRIIRRPKGGLSRKDFWDMIRDLHDEEGD